MAGNGTRMQLIASAVRARQARWWVVALGFTVSYYLAMLAAVAVRFGSLPNYLVSYDWFGNVSRIVASTPSLRDTVEIVSAEWILEVGYMNYQFGHGIAEWSLFLLPTKVFGVMALGALLATWAVVPKSTPRRCLWRSERAIPLAGGLGAGLVALSSITLSWVVCCSTPTWIVALAMMGVSASVALWLEPAGSWMTLLGFAAVCMALYLSVDASSENERATQSIETGQA